MPNFRLFDFHCDACGQTFEHMISDDRRTELCRCGGGYAVRLMSSPRVQTIETHMRGTDMMTSHGGYFDHNLRDLKTGEVPYVTSVAQKNQILKDRGFVEVGPTDQSRDRERSRTSRIYSR